ncbi:unnamed protein product [Rotaria sp. Silwood2]|nr:unnamed protein product [Rotaria sp. Silwood2]
MKIGTLSRLSMNTCILPIQKRISQPGDDFMNAKNISNSVQEATRSLTSHLTDPKQHAVMISILEKNSLLFGTAPRKFITSIHHVIDTGNHPPISGRSYFKTIQHRKDFQQEIDKMLKSGIIIPSNSPWLSPAILLKKPNGEFRFIVDYRKLNSITRKDSYPQPTTEKLLQRLGGHTWFTKLDLKSGYFQIPIQNREKEKTALCSQDGLYQFEVLSMGLMNAPPTFQRVMNNIIGYNRWDFVVVYLDDIIIFSHSFDEHMKHLDEILAILIITDYLTKFVVAKAVANNTAPTAAQTFVEEFILKFWVPNRLITDQGTHFNNDLMKNAAQLIGFTHIKSVPYHPQTNGQVERFNATFRPQLTKLYDENLNHWDEYLPAVVYAYNTGSHATTGYSPFQLMFERNPILLLAQQSTEFTLTKPNNYWPQIQRLLKLYHQAARRNIHIQQHYAKARFDANRSDTVYQVNDLVLWRKPFHLSKLDEPYSGPHIILKANHPNYVIQDRESSIQRMVHVADLQPVLGVDP